MTPSVVSEPAQRQQMRDKDKGLTWERLNDLFEVYPETGILIWRKNPGKMNKAGRVAGDLNHRFGYVIISIDRKKYKRHRLIWFYVHREWPPEDLDHINGLRSEDSISNLRLATRSQNLWNAGKSKTNTSGHKGVSWRKTRGKWRASIMKHGIYHVLGDFSDVNDAIKARKEAEIQLHQGFTRNDENSTVSYPASNTIRRA
jgi:hypothetical protein